MTLTEFLIARYDKDRAGALARISTGTDPYAKGEGTPNHTIADVEAKRRMVALHGPAYIEGDPRDEFGTPSDARYCRGCNADWREEWAELLDACPTKRLLALPYADHPDYDEAWRP